ncbi:MAG: hypothetical protein LBJ11_05575 [Oscillospiraceae bacterium]|jgi:hypothetical protein|nr:hypothetical protein [Oscillospiraceae bacterium]
MKDKQLYRIDKDGNLNFQPLDKLHRDKYKPDSVWNHTWVLMLIVIACMVADFASMSSLFAAFLYDNVFLRYICIIGMVLVMEVAPIYLSYSLKKRACGYNVETISIVIPLVAFVVGAVINIMLRIVTRNEAFPDLSNLTTSVIGGGAVQTGDSSKPLYYAIFFAILPILTSLIAFAATYTMSNPLNHERKKLEKAHIDLIQHIDQLEAVLSEYDSDGNYLERMQTDDDAKYNAALSMIRSQRDEYFDYCRQRISEHLASPGATSYEVDYALKSNYGEDAAV